MPTKINSLSIAFLVSVLVFLLSPENSIAGRKKDRQSRQSSCQSAATPNTPVFVEGRGYSFVSDRKLTYAQIDWSKIGFILFDHTNPNQLANEMTLAGLSGTDEIQNGSILVRTLTKPLNGFTELNRITANFQKGHFFGVFVTFEGSDPTLFLNQILAESKGDGRGLVRWAEDRGLEIVNRGYSNINIRPKSDSNTNLFEALRDLQNSGLVRYADFNRLHFLTR